MAFRTGVIDFVRIPDATDPNKVYAIGPGGRPMDNEQMLMEYTGEKTAAEAFKHVRLVSPEEALSVGVTAAEAKRKTVIPPPPEAPPKEKPPTPPKEPIKEGPQLVRFDTSIHVYDISDGTLKYVSASDFESKGYKWEDVQLIKSDTVGLRKDASGEMFTNINGQDIKIVDTAKFKETNIPTDILTVGKEIDVEGLIDEYTSGERLGLVWDKDPDLQALYTRDGNGKVGTGAEGTTIYDWATQIGWREYPELLDEYRPENVVRAAYQYLFARDPFDPANPDPGALSWVQAIKSGEISGFEELTGMMKLDAGGEWDSLSRGEQDANLLKWERSIADIPEFAEFFPQAKIYEEVKKETEDFYGKQLDHYLEGKEIEEKRTIEDWTQLTKELTEDEEAGLTESQLQFRNSLRAATEAYGQAGLTFSTIRRGGEQQLREALERRKERIGLEAERARGKLTTEKERRLEDLRRQEEEQRIKVERATRIETEQTFAGREARAVQRYMLGLQFAETIPGVQNIYGQSAFTGFGKFVPPSIQEESQKKISEMFGELKPYGT